MSGKPLGSVRMITQSFRAEPEQCRKMAALGGGEWLRAMIDATPWPRGAKENQPARPIPPSCMGKRAR
jgi:hypothetical protein